VQKPVNPRGRPGGEMIFAGIGGILVTLVRTSLKFAECGDFYRARGLPFYEECSSGENAGELFSSRVRAVAAGPDAETASAAVAYLSVLNVRSRTVN
jgi:hypothetical protein